MSASKRGDIFTKTHKVLSKHYKPHSPVERPLLEQILYAFCLEDSPVEAADEAYARLQESFFDWNEVRVTGVRELTEILRGLVDPERAATQIKQTLHSVFEAIYEFDLEALKKANLGAAVKQLQQYRGTNNFAVSYAVQHALGGHSIPVSPAALQLMFILGAISQKELEEQSVPGLERAIPKTKGTEFASLLHQFASDFAKSPYGTEVRAIILEIEPDAKGRLPSRRSPKKTESSSSSKAGSTKSATTSEPDASTKKTKAKTTPKKVAKSTDHPAEGGKKKKKAKTAGKTPTPAKKKTAKKTTKKKPTITKKASPRPKKSASKQLARRKPR